MKQFIKNTARLLDTAARSATAVDQISQKTDFDLEEAYAIQKESIGYRLERGEQLTGYKLGFTSKAKMEQMGVHEIIWGRLTDKMHIRNGGNLDLSSFIHPRVEPEIAFLIKKKITEPLASENVKDYIKGVAGALEIIDSRYQNFKFSLEDVIADNCSSSAYVLGEWKDIDTAFENIGIRLIIDGKYVQTGRSSAILGNPLDALVEITRILSKNQIEIQAGAIILAGAATSAEYLQKGCHVEGGFDGLGTVELKVN